MPVQFGGWWSLWTGRLVWVVLVALRRLWCCSVLGLVVVGRRVSVFVGWWRLGWSSG